MRPARDAVTIVSVAIAIALACRPLREDPAQRLLRGRADADPEIERACQLTGQRCTRCHDIDRVLDAKVSQPLHWERYIERMRMMNASGISRSDSPIILRCLVFRSFGRPGIEFLDTRPPPD